MSGYYDEILDRIKGFIEQDQLEEARFLIQEELKMPYIPQNVEEKLHQYLLETVKETSFKPLSDEKLRLYLTGNETQQLIALRQLANQNIRLYLAEIHQAFASPMSALVRIALMEILANQQVSDEFEVMIDGFIFQFIPAALELPQDSEGVHQCQAYLCDWLESENPSMLALCLECVIKEAYLRMPFSIEEDEAKPFATAICRYVSSLLGCEDEMNLLLCEKNVAQTGSFDLLLYSNNI